MNNLRLTGFCLLLVFCLGGCLSRGDSLAPIVTLDPQSGAVRRADNLEVRGYAMDDEGIVSIRVNNVEFLETEGYKVEKNKKLIQFAFKPAAQGDQFVSTLVITDSSGRVTEHTYELQIDTTPPTVEILEVTNLGSRLRVRGVARDNDLLKSITVAGQTLPSVPVQERDFNFDVDITENMTLEVEDRAGNRVVQPLEP